MAQTIKCKWMALALLLGLLLPAPGWAWSAFLADWANRPCTTCSDRPSGTWRDCPPNLYSPLHVAAPGLFRARALVHPSNLDQYTEGPLPGAAPTFQITRFPCRSTPPAASAPYADPAGYFGRPVTQSFALP